MRDDEDFYSVTKIFELPPQLIKGESVFIFYFFGWYTVTF